MRASTPRGRKPILTRLSPRACRTHPSAPSSLAERGISAVIWCTGFDGDFGWVKVPGALDARGQPVHEEGVSIQPGLYFAGLDFAVTRKSGTLLSLAEEGPRLINHLLERH